MSDHYYAVIMAGGGGTRLWPLSRRHRPKQMLQLGGERTLFQIAVDRLEGLFPPKRILIVTASKQALALQEQVPEIQSGNFLLEPEPRGTASAIGLAAAALKLRDPEAVMAVLTADHYIGDEEKFLKVLKAAESVAKDGYLVTLGIRPTFASTGYGYIQQGKKLGSFGGFDAYQAERFKEKPAEAQAKEMLESGNHAWNSGMFIWQVERILEEFARQMPELSSSLEVIADAWETPERDKVLNRKWSALKAETIDYGIMENAVRVAVIPTAGLKWNDVGSWDSLFEVMAADAQGNIISHDEHINIGSTNTMVHSEGSKRLIVTIGVEDMVIVDTDDILLVCSKDRAEDVRQAINQIKEKGQERFL
jgi:mannose-1-phosphate guanylyltransferase